MVVYKARWARRRHGNTVLWRLWRYKNRKDCQNDLQTRANWLREYFSYCFRQWCAASILRRDRLNPAPNQNFWHWLLKEFNLSFDLYVYKQQIFLNTSCKGFNKRDTITWSLHSSFSVVIFIFSKQWSILLRRKWSRYLVKEICFRIENDRAVDCQD